MSGIPHVRIDGSRSHIGASNCASAANTYRTSINARLAETGGVSPVEIEGSYIPGETAIAASAVFRLVDPVALTNLRATLLVFEDNVLSGGQLWQHVTRDMYDQSITLTNVGDEVVVATSFPVGATWNLAELHFVAYLQVTTGNKQIVQGAVMQIGDFNLDVALPVRSVPDGNGSAVFDALLTNVGDATDTFTIQEGTSFGTWWTDVMVCGDSEWRTGPVQVDLDPDESCAIQFRVHTDGAVEARNGALQVTSQASARSFQSSLRVFNGSWSVFLVDDDGSRTDEVVIDQALTGLGYLRDSWRVMDHGGAGPSANDVLGYDFLIWQTGLNFSNPPILQADMNAMKAYVDAGGRLLLTSQHYLNHGSLDPTFTAMYLGVDTWTIDTSYSQMVGVAGDPIGDGLSLASSIDPPSLNKADHAVPNATGTTFLTAPGENQAGIRNEFTTRTTQRVVFLPWALHGLVDGGAPNNVQGVLGRILDWLEPEGTVGVDDLVAASGSARILGATPNPFHPRTEISFAIPQTAAAAGAVRLEVFDLTGRKVAGLHDGALEAGTHTFVWTGLSDAGRAVESGVYFARLTTAKGESSQKLVLMR